LGDSVIPQKETTSKLLFFIQKKEAKFKMAFGGSFSPKSSPKFPPNLMIKYGIL
jgi:hypothetical protein